MSSKFKNLFLNLQDWQKIIIAITATILITGSVFGGYNWVANANFRDSVTAFFDPSYQSRVNPSGLDSATLREVNNINNILSGIDPTLDVYETIKMTDLNIYPKPWVNRYFNEDQRLNALVSGPSGDPDGDGLTNKQEYFYGSSPLKRDSLCDGKNIGDNVSPTSPVKCNGQTDKQLVDARLSPLNGLELDTPATFRVLRQDKVILDDMRDGFEKASEEGTDFTTLFQLSKEIDLTPELEAISVNNIADEATAILNYRKTRLEIIGSFVDGSEITSLSKIYQIVQVEQLTNLKKQYQRQVDRLIGLGVPESLVTSHKAFIFVFKKLVELVAYREEGFQNKTTGTEEFKTTSRQKSIEMIWGYKRLGEESAKFENR